jgi:hypothetical protein
LQEVNYLTIKIRLPYNMKKIVTLILLLIIVKSACGQNLKALDDQYGFREGKFEKPKESIYSLVEFEKGTYATPLEILSYGEYRLRDVIYRFYKGQLTYIRIRTTGSVNSRGVLKLLQSEYGPGNQPDKNIEKYWWNGQKVTMSFDQDPKTNDAVIIMTCNKLQDLEKSEKGKKVR